MTQPILSSEEKIIKLIPQRNPFVLVDKIYEHSENEILSGFTIPQNHILVDSRGNLSEAGLIEHFAQSIALHQGYDFYLKNETAPVGYIGSIKNIEIFSLPKSGAEIRTRIKILQQIMGVTMVEGEVFFNEKLIAKGEMRTIVARDFE
jgi:predicted hotdog family 3-hydroxylacyl-ACP dehydratase